MILVTGGTGKTGRRLAARLRDAGAPFAVASRAAAGPESRSFDWTRRETWAPALEGVSAVYLVPPPTGADAPTMIAFVQSAIDRGARRFVLLSGSPIPAGGPLQGEVHAWLQTHAAEWAVLRPSWFMQNFSEGQHLATIREDDAIYSATADGRTPFIDADDIAAAALAALTRPQAPNADFILTGERALTYDEVAALIGAAAGRPIVHRRIEASEVAERHRARGLPATTAQMLAIMDLAIAGGAEDRVTDAVQALTGRPAIRFEDFAQASVGAFTRL